MSDDALKARLAELEERRAARARAREQSKAARSLADDVAAAERLDALEEALVAAEAEHGPSGRGVAVVHARYADGRIAGSAIVKRPHHAFWARAAPRLGSAKPDALAEETMRVVAHCRVWPELGQIEALTAEVPALPTLLLDAIARLAGVQLEEVAGKP